MLGYIMLLSGCHNIYILYIYNITVIYKKYILRIRVLYQYQYFIINLCEHQLINIKKEMSPDSSLLSSDLMVAPLWQFTDRLYYIDLLTMTLKIIIIFIDGWGRIPTNIVTSDHSCIAFSCPRILGIFLNWLMSGEYLQWCAYRKRRVINHYYYWSNILTF